MKSQKALFVLNIINKFWQTSEGRKEKLQQIRQQRDEITTQHALKLKKITESSAESTVHRNRLTDYKF